MRQKLSEGAKPGYDARVGSGLSRGPNLRKKAVAAAWSQTWPAPGATLDLDFANDRGYVRGVGQGRSMDAVTFTRASNANFVKPDGTLSKWANVEGKNLLSFPQDFDNAAWTKNDSSIIANAETAPDGTITADKLVETATTAGHRTLQNIPVGGAGITFSVFAKKAEREWCSLRVTNTSGTGVYAWFDLNTGSVGTVETGLTASISSAGNDWYRCSITIASTSLTIPNTQIATATADNTYAYLGNTSSGIFIWGAQLELGSTATTYYPTNINQPRFDWASTAVVANKNLLTFTEQFTVSPWFTLGGDPVFVINANTAGTTDPLGGNTADEFIPPNGSTDTRRLQNPVTLVSGQTYTYSIYAKAGGITSFSLGSRDGGIGSSTFNLSAVTATGTGTITSVGNGWYRCSFYGTSDGSSTRTYQIQVSQTGDAVKNIYFWGAQVEMGAALTDYQAIAQSTTNTPLTANPTSNGLLIEESRTNRILWNRDATSGTGTNLLLYSEQINNAYWNLGAINAFGSGSVANTLATTDPLGTNTAEFVQENTSLTQHAISLLNPISLIVGTTYTWSVYIKPAGRSWVNLRLGGTSNFINTADGTIGTVASGSTVTATSVGNGWYRCAVTLTATSTAGNAVRLADANNSDNYTGDGVSGIYIWGAQLTPYEGAGQYQVTTTAALYGWSRNNATVAKDQTGIDGVANAATSITASAANGILIQPISLASGSRTASVYLKRITGTGTVQVSLDGSTWSTVDLSSTEWRRIVLSGTVTNPTVGIKIATNGDAVAMDYAQVEDGAFATTPILTTTATVTRSADTASITGANFNSWYNFSNGTISVSWANISSSVSSTSGIDFSDGGVNNKISIRSNSILSSVAGVTQFQFNIGVQGTSKSTRVVGYRIDDSAASYNSSVASKDTGCSISTGINGLRFTVDGSVNLNSTISRLTYYPVRLNDSIVQELAK